MTTTSTAVFRDGEPQPELFLNRGENRRPGVGIGPLDLHIEETLDFGSVHHGIVHQSGQHLGEVGHRSRLGDDVPPAPPRGGFSTRGSVEFRPVLIDPQHVGLNCPRFAMRFELEAVLQQSLEHLHDHVVVVVDRLFRLGRNVECVGFQPRRPADDLIGTHRERTHDASLQCLVFNQQSAFAGRHAALRRIGAAGPDGSNPKPRGLGP